MAQTIWQMMKDLAASPFRAAERTAEEYPTFDRILNLAKEIAETPGTDILTPVALTHRGLLKAAYKLGVKGTEKEARRGFAKAVYRLKPEHISQLKGLEAVPERELKKGIAGMYRPEARKIFSEALTEPSKFTTPFHEIAHHKWAALSPKDKSDLRVVFDQMWPKSKRARLSRKLGASLSDFQEAFSEADSRYMFRDPLFWDFPPKFRDIVKKYAGTR